MGRYGRYAAIGRAGVAGVLACALAAGCGAGRSVTRRGAGAEAPGSGARTGGEVRPSARARVVERAAPRSFTLVAAGDVIPTHPEVLDTAQEDAPLDGYGYDFRPMLKGVAPVVSGADVALCHLDAPLGPLDGPFTGYPLLQSPPQIATALKAAGYDSCGIASNHVLDQGLPGIRRTLDALDTVGLRHPGAARDGAEAARPVLLRAPGGARVAHLSYTDGIEGDGPPDDAARAVNLLEEKTIVSDARAARRAGADVVVVSPAWGTEYRTAPDEEQLALARALTAAETDGRPDIDLIVGTHAHTPQPYEKVNGTWVVYGLGDQVSGAMRQPRGNWGTLARFRFAPPERPGGRWRVTEAAYVPQLAEQGTRVRVRNLARTGAHRDVRDRIRAAVLSRGAAEDGLTMGR
ncbi:lipoprotein [Streptomyces nigrescens]|uniref:Lipoprotein n=1 Tax=Streptomyces nigrescens TaxID=1920 RepID=A0ABN6QXT8_STRNI|nr:lipoprotein [Streptomyces nigrescens]